MRFETPGEDRYRDAYRALRELQVALQAIAARSAAHRTDLERVAGHHLGTIERLIESEHLAFLRTAPGRMILTDEEARTLPGLRTCPEGGICHKGCQGDHCWREALGVTRLDLDESAWQARMRKAEAAEAAVRAAADIERRLAQDAHKAPPAVLHLNPGEKDITPEEAHRRVQELGFDPASYNGVLVIPADMPPIDLDGYAADQLAALLYEACEPEHPADPTGVDSHERYESPGDQA